MRDYVQRLMARGEMRVVEREVDPRHELAAVTKLSQAEDERPLLFRRVKGSRLPVVTNIYGSRKRLRELIGATDGSFCRRWQALSSGLQPSATSFLNPVAPPADLKDGTLSELPQITYWERDAGPYFTAAIYLAREPDTGVANLSFHRSMYVSDTELRIRLGGTHDLTRYQQKAEARGQALPAALLIGTAPDIFLAAAASLPYETDELSAAAQIRGRPIDMRPCRSIDLMVPADTEIVVEGEILPDIRRPEGPFGEFMGYYVPVGDNHVFQVKHVSYRENAVFHGLLCGSPEDIVLLQEATASRIYRLLSQQVRGVVDVAIHASLLCTVVSIKQLYPGHARHVALAAVGSHLDYNKAAIVVDDDVDIHDLDDVWWAFLTRGRVDTRTTIIPDVPGFYRDPERDHWGRLMIDATKPLGREAEFERRRIPGEDRIRLKDYVSD
ncbi:MAG: UbiD family decarboxylase [Proteobacteria bacterium]|nr:UbiD family decarboxylase [Pseudomonadota bacterium]MBI3498408.1 UbiD family decarboxylase [Pseudomonadota bacterium]